MSNTSSEPVTTEAINALLARVDAMERASQTITRGLILGWYRPLAELPLSLYWPCDGTAAPDGVTTPDLRGRTPFGLKSSDGAFDTLGETGGAASHVHTGSSHVHTIDHDHPSFDTGTTSSTSNANTATGGGTHGDATDTHTHPANVPSFAAAGAPIPDSGSAGGGNTGSAASYPPYAVMHWVYRWA